MNLDQSAQDLEPDTDDEVFIAEHAPEKPVKSELVTLRTTPTRKINMPDPRHSGPINAYLSPTSFKA